MAIGRALFGSSAGQSQSKNLVEFRAGKMELKGKMVHPDKRKGLVYVYQSDDSLMHFCWKDRTSGTVVDDLIIFPEDVEYKRVQQCTTGRVYLLKFKSTNRKLFFWMQEPKTEKDEDHCKKVNEYLNHPPAVRSGGSTPGALPSDLSTLGDSDIQALLNNMSQQQLVQFFGNVGGVSTFSNLLGNRSQSSSSSSSQAANVSSASAAARQETTTTTATTTTTTTTASSAPTTAQESTPTTNTAPSTPNIQLSDLQNILSGIQVPPTTEQTSPRSAIDLSTAINMDSIQPILSSNPEFLERLQSLMPQGDGSSVQPTDELRETLQSPQFQQAMSNFSTALASGQLGPLMQQFGINEEAINAAANGDMEAFLNAMQNAKSKDEDNKANAEKKKQPEKDKDKDEDDDDDDDDRMAVN